MSPSDFRRRVDDLKRSVSLRSLIEADGHKIVRSGGLDKCCCPFHKEKTPSFVIYPDGHAHCFGCDFHGDLFTFTMRKFGCDFKTAVERLSNGSHLVTCAPRAILAGKKKEPELPKDYFKNMWCRWVIDTAESNRKESAFALAQTLGVMPESLCMIGMAVTDEGDFAFPMFDYTVYPIGIRLRDYSGKKWAVKGSKQGLFIPGNFKQPDLYVTEGPTDCAAMLSMGLFAIGKAAAMQGPEEIVKFIAKNRIRRVIVIADNDRAGLNGAKKLIDVCPVPCCELVLPAKDAREFYRNGGTKELIENLLKSAVWRRTRHA